MYSADKMKILGETPLLFLLAAALAVTGALVHFVVLPACGTLLSRHAERTRYETIISSESGFQLLKKEIGAQIATLEHRLTSLPDRETVTADPGSFLELLIATARKSEVRFTRMQPQEEQASGTITRYPVLLSFTTSYHELGQFIAALEKLPYLFSVDRVAISTDDKGECNVRLLATCLIPKGGADE
jgi:Tfp pilus assembly protein PilO